MLILWEKLLTPTAKTQARLQAQRNSLDRMVKSLEICLKNYNEISYDKIKLSAVPIAEMCGITPRLTRHTVLGLFRFYTLRAMRSSGLLQEGDLDTKMQFVCDRIRNTAIQQLELRFSGQHKVAENFKCLEFETLSSSSDEELRDLGKRLQGVYEHDFVGQDLPADLVDFVSDYKDMFGRELTSPKSILKFILLEDLTFSYPALENALRLYLTIPVTVASAERSFSKLKIIKNYLRSTMSQGRLASLAILSIEEETSMGIDCEVIAKKFLAKRKRTSK